MNKLPDFLCLGSQKSGTTWLHEELKKHSDIDLPNKELRYFDPWNLYSKEEYLRKFENLNGITGEFTPEYFHSVKAPIQIRDLVPNCKLFVVLRNPAERAYSQWRMARDMSLICKSKTFLECFDSDARRMRTKGVYMLHLSEYHKSFEKIKVFLYNDLLDNPKCFVHSICEYIGARTEYHETPWMETQYHKDGLSMNFQEYEHAIDFYRKPISELESFLDIQTNWTTSVPKHIIKFT
jgi:hypothetical protein